jgi:thymidylate synthase (FAD)
MTTHNVLSLGYVKLVDFMGGDNRVVDSARVSYGKDNLASRDPVRDEKLIHYLWRNKHTSPFESTMFTFEVKAPIFVVRQWMRHRTWSYNEISARYTEVDDDFYIPEPGAFGHQSKSNKQQRDVDMYQENGVLWFCTMRDHCLETIAKYQSYLRQGMPRELARTILPQNMYTRFYGTVNLANLFKFLSLRDHDHAQFEIREYAKAIDLIVADKCPISHSAFKGSLYYV